MLKFLAIASVLGFAGCVGVDESTDTGADSDEASASQASTLYDRCAVGLDQNGAISAINVGDSIVRSTDTINGTGTNQCDCLQWQKDMNATGHSSITTCRPTTVVEAQLGSWRSYSLGAKVTSWHLTNGETECNNSTVNVKVQKWNQTTLQFETLPGGASGDLHPHWNGTSCEQVVFAPRISVDTENYYQVRAVATRGLGTPGFAHGFEGVTVYAIP